MAIKDFVRKAEKKFFQDPGRVITRLFIPDNPEKRINSILDRILKLPDQEAESILKEVHKGFSSRHRNIRGIFDVHYRKIMQLVPEYTKRQISTARKALIGAYFTQEYSIQAAAFFNPSIVPHPDQQHLGEGSLRFILSFRSTGEGHISSVEFRCGIINTDHDIVFEPVNRYATLPEIIKNPVYDKHTFRLKLEEVAAADEISETIFSGLADQFSSEDLYLALSRFRSREQEPGCKETLSNFRWLADSNYSIKFNPEIQISERVIFPNSDAESKGIEDARFVLFRDDDGEETYYATYTAYNGSRILPMLIRTGDFLEFDIRTLNGKVVQNKGMALFPRKIKGKYAMISRYDGENLYLMYSKNLFFWQQAVPLYQPRAHWEFIQVGNGGSPIEIDEGWLLITHGVGPVREYTLGVLLLDKEHPERILRLLPEPLLTPSEEEREGYVPNVVYTCGALVHNGELILPYAMSDTSSGIAFISLEKLLAHMIPCKNEVNR